jgi:dolichol-phosphate mannosyltransferase
MLYSVILPTYNERENLPIIFYLLDKVFTEHKIDYEVVIVDDSSPDNTLEVAKAIQASYGEQHVTIVSREGKLGLGTAYIAGLRVAKGQRIVLMDADLSHHPKFVPQMIDCMDQTNAHIVTGTRYALGGGVYGWDLKRKITRYSNREIIPFVVCVLCVYSLLIVCGLVAGEFCILLY